MARRWGVTLAAVLVTAVALANLGAPATVVGLSASPQASPLPGSPAASPQAPPNTPTPAAPEVGIPPSLQTQVAGLPSPAPARTPPDKQTGPTPPAADPAETQALPGLVAYAERLFVASGTRFVGTAAFRFGVLEFRSEELAAASFPGVVAQVRNAPGLIGAREASAPRVAQQSVALAGDLHRDDSGAGASVDVAYLLFRDGRFVHVWAGAGLAADPLPELVDLAGAVLGRPEDGGGLLDRLPTLQELPTGFVLEGEAAERAPSA